MSGLASIALAASMSSSVSLADGRPACAPSSPMLIGYARLGALPDQAGLEFRQRAEHVKNKPPLRGRRVEDFGQAAKPDTLTRRVFDSFD